MHVYRRRHQFSIFFLCRHIGLDHQQQAVEVCILIIIHGSYLAQCWLFPIYALQVEDLNDYSVGFREWLHEYDTAELLTDWHLFLFPFVNSLLHPKDHTLYRYTAYPRFPVYKMFRYSLGQGENKTLFYSPLLALTFLKSSLNTSEGPVSSPLSRSGAFPSMLCSPRTAWPMCFVTCALALLQGYSFTRERAWGSIVSLSGWEA